MFDKVFSRKSDYSEQLLADITGQPFEKAASVVETASKEDIATAISNAKKIDLNGHSKKASVGISTDVFKKKCEVLFADEAVKWLTKRCEFLGASGASIRAFNVSDKLNYTRNGIKNSNLTVKDAECACEISSNSFGPGNSIFVKMSKDSGKLLDPEFMYLNKKVKFAFDSDGWDAMLKYCMAPVEETVDSSDRHFVVMEYKEYPNIGKQPVYRSFGKFSNAHELKHMLKDAGFAVIDKYRMDGFGNACEILPMEATDMSLVRSIIKTSGCLCDAAVVEETNDFAVIDMTRPVETAPVINIDSDTRDSQIYDMVLSDLPENLAAKFAGTNSNVVSEGSNSPAKSNPKSHKEVNGPGGTETVISNSGSKDDAGQGSHETDPAWDDSDTGDAPAVIDNGSNSEAKSNPKMEKIELEGPGGKAEVAKNEDSKDDAVPSIPGSKSQDRATETAKAAASESPTRDFDAAYNPDKARGTDAEDEREAAKTDDGTIPGSARRAALAKFKAASEKKNEVVTKEAALNVDIGVDAPKTKQKNLKNQVQSFFKSFHYLDEAADEFSDGEKKVTRGEIAQQIMNILRDGFKVVVEGADKDKGWEYNRNVTSIVGKIKIVDFGEGMPETDSDGQTKSAAEDVKKKLIEKLKKVAQYDEVNQWKALEDEVASNPNRYKSGDQRKLIELIANLFPEFHPNLPPVVESTYIPTDEDIMDAEPVFKHDPGDPAEFSGEDDDYDREFPETRYAKKNSQVNPETPGGVTTTDDDNDTVETAENESDASMKRQQLTSQGQAYTETKTPDGKTQFSYKSK